MDLDRDRGVVVEGTRPGDGQGRAAIYGTSGLTRTALPVTTLRPPVGVEDRGEALTEDTEPLGTRLWIRARARVREGFGLRALQCVPVRRRIWRVSFDRVGRRVAVGGVRHVGRCVRRPALVIDIRSHGVRSAVRDVRDDIVDRVGIRHDIPGDVGIGAVGRGRPRARVLPTAAEVHEREHGEESSHGAEG